MRLKKAEVNREMQLSLLPFDQTNSLFVRIPKSAGRSLSLSLYGCLVGSHITMRDYQIAYSEAELKAMFKYTFVRNPWDRLVSAYFFLKEGGVTGDDKKFSERYLSNVDSFEDFVKNHLHRREIRSFTHFIPQVDFLEIKGELVIDFVGLFENIVHDFEFIRKTLVVSRGEELRRNNITKTRKKTSYQDYYNEETREIVEMFYARDIEMFGYRFAENDIEHLLKFRNNKFGIGQTQNER